MACAVALETLRIIDERGIIEHVRSVSEPFHRRLAELGSHTIASNPRGIGLLGAVNITSDGHPSTFDDRVAARCAAHGLNTRVKGGVVSLIPPVIVGEGEIAFMLGAVRAALDDVCAD